MVNPKNGLSNEDVAQLKSFIDKNRKNWSKNKVDVIEFAGANHLPGNVQYIASTDEVIIHLGQIGQGGYKTVSAAVDYDTGKRYAAAISNVTAPVDQLGNPDVLWNEPATKGAEMSKMIKDVPNVLTTEHSLFFEENGQVKICELQELFEGGTLENVSLTAQERSNLTEQMLEALASLHSKDIAHGDINLDNILLNEDKSQAVLMDWGLSLAKGKPDWDRSYIRNDVLNLGVVLYKLYFPKALTDDAQIRNLKTFAPFAEPDLNTEERIIWEMLLPQGERITAQEAYQKFSDLRGAAT